MYRMVWKKSTAMISAALQHDVGWPEPAAVVAWMELMRSRLAVSFRACSFCWSGLW